ncbi:hypothetical protein XENTR_v10010771 [Xenopus tropicalis]|nr:hypothetical protein XENTR_v10010771 [Xenopus tropicalis]
MGKKHTFCFIFTCALYFTIYQNTECERFHFSVCKFIQSLVNFNSKGNLIIQGWGGGCRRKVPPTGVMGHSPQCDKWLQPRRLKLLPSSCC